MKATLNLYMYELFKSKYLEENKDKVFKEDELDNLIKEKYNLLFIYEINNHNDKVLDHISKYGTEITIDGYEYNKTTIANILDKLSTNGKYKINPEEIHIVDSERIDENTKSIIVCIGNSLKSYKLNININNSTIIRKREYKAIGINMLPIDESYLDLEDDINTNIILDYLNSNEYCYTRRKVLNGLVNYGLDNKFMRKWDKENIMVCANVDITSEFFCNGDCDNCEYECGDDEDYD